MVIFFMFSSSGFGNRNFYVGDIKPWAGKWYGVFTPSATSATALRVRHEYPLTQALDGGPGWSAI
jgi:hypothetical protein